jgi:hypothetical protein
MTTADDGTRTPDPEHQGRHGGQSAGSGPGRSGIATGPTITHENPGTNVTGGDTPGGGGTRPLEFDDRGRAIPLDDASRPAPKP